MSQKKLVRFNKKRTVEGKISNNGWIIILISLSFVISTVLSLSSEVLLRNVEVLEAFIILILIISIGIIFDIIGVAVTAADEKPFHSMASRKITGARTAIFMIRNASRISSICNDVIGDISGIISGTICASIAARLILFAPENSSIFLTIIISSTVAAITVGGKALGKHLAIAGSNNIVYRISYIIEKVRAIFK